MQHCLAAIQVLNELGNAAVVLKFGRLGFAGLGISGPLVSERDQQAFVEEC